MTTDPQTFRASWQKGLPDAVERLKAALQAARNLAGSHASWARICEEAGQDGLALTEYQLALRDDPNDACALERLTELYRERGEHDRALECAERLILLAPGNPAALRGMVALYLESGMNEKAEEALARAEASGMGIDVTGPLAALLRSSSDSASREEEEKVASTMGVPADADVARFAHLFSGRENVYARQWWNESGEGGYTPVHQPMVFQVVRNHLLGSITIGVYPVRLDNTVTFFALDIDINKRAIARARGSIQESRRLRDAVSAEARRLHSLLTDMGLPPLLEDSGYKGRHLWVFLQEPVEAAIIRQFGSLCLGCFPLQSVDLHAEFFPKQPSTGQGIGNLIKLPLGIHRRTGRRARLLLPDGVADPDPFATLRSLKKVPREVLFEVIVSLKSRGAAAPVPALPEDASEAPEVPAAPAPPLPPPAWTAADFDTNPEVSHLLRSCAVAAALREKAEKHRRLGHDEQVVLIHSLGHSASGVLAVNYLFDMCVDVPGSARLQTPLSGNPISCPRIRKRVPHVTGQLDCNCSFEFDPDHYPTPRLHLQTMPKLPVPAPAPASGWDPAERTRTLGVLRVRRAEIEGEIVDLEKELLRHLERTGQDRIGLDDGALVLKHEPGALPALVWEPSNPPAATEREKG